MRYLKIYEEEKHHLFETTIFSLLLRRLINVK